MQSALGDFLRARRHAMLPDTVGLPRGGNLRRTPGLRREDVAVLAGVSVDYYTRLEQGRERRPSDQVLDALARVFHLDDEASDHLHRLARPRARRSGVRREEGQVHPQVLQLLDEWDRMPACVINRRTDVLARNRMSAAFLEGFEHTDNFLRMLFLSPGAKEISLDWEYNARAMVAHLRASVGADHEDPSLLDLVRELSDKSEDFRRMWARHDVRTRRRDLFGVRHPVVGDLKLWHESFSIDSAPGQRLFIAKAEPGSPSEDALAKLSAAARGTESPARA
ncbi:helix-turn-helix transcriptional regulator [Microbispora sp. ATCC PTA-5024]|uniref:helix-turn-helix transcriptional regulator n=1 Tax=Microbispora sp. ATCC PTA-5024 TaxID=316330 RepID=UPI0003DD600D|nr:helix-turn-helix transcriptional regulator [Microbispora sp. ATCC PTA-5024]ETK36667.1 XRE family transcriptional regulator [Microbispora sp. ATCC PTA-5024]